jgi:hypothetical protein
LHLSLKFCPADSFPTYDLRSYRALLDLQHDREDWQKELTMKAKFSILAAAIGLTSLVASPAIAQQTAEQTVTTTAQAAAPTSPGVTAPATAEPAAATYPAAPPAFPGAVPGTTAADQNGDGVIDGYYTSDGMYRPIAPPAPTVQPLPVRTVSRRGERG